jgi:hypothetical protein
MKHETNPDNHADHPKFRIKDIVLTGQKLTIGNRSRFRAETEKQMPRIRTSTNAIISKKS